MQKHLINKTNKIKHKTHQKFIPYDQWERLHSINTVMVQYNGFNVQEKPRIDHVKKWCKILWQYSSKVYDKIIGVIEDTRDMPSWVSISLVVISKPTPTVVHFLQQEHTTAYCHSLSLAYLNYHIPQPGSKVKRIFGN